jgi:hypothetical protein
MAEEKNVNPEVNQETGEIVEQGKNEVVQAKAPNQSYVAMILEEERRGFLEANEGMDFDYVRMGDWLKMDKKGNFVERDNEDVNYGDTMDVVVGYGEQRWTLWGHEGTPEDGQIIAMEQKEEEAHAALGNWLELNPEAAERYKHDDIKLRYMAYVVPVDGIKEASETDDMPPVYLMSFPQGDTIAWGKFAQAAYTGKYKTLGIPRKTGAASVIVRFSSEVRENKSKESYLGIKFSPVGLFVPADYGINY